MTVYKCVTPIIVEELDKGVPPWVRASRDKGGDGFEAHKVLMITPKGPTDYDPQTMPGQQPHDYAEEEMLYNRFMEPALREGLSFLAFPKTDGTVLDAGCGPGGLFPLLLEALGPSGALVAIDRSTPHLRVDEVLIASQELQERVQLARVDLESTLSYRDASFDGVWCADVITPDDFADIPSVVSELFRVLKPVASSPCFTATG